MTRPAVLPFTTVRRSEERERENLGWLDSRHTFSGGDCEETNFMGFRSLRAINEDRVAPGEGFGMHSHRDMEIFSYVLDGELEHKDSLGNGRVIKPGDIQLLSAGTGISHSEFNPSDQESCHFLQIWIQPATRFLSPKYHAWNPRANVSKASKALIFSRDGRQDSALIQQHADVWRLRMKSGETVTHELQPGRGLWLQVVRGQVKLNDLSLLVGDGASVETPGTIAVIADTEAEALLFDLA